MLLHAKTFHRLLDLLFPVTCVGCACHGWWLCPACWQELANPRPLTCFGCGREDPLGRTCPGCHHRRPELTGLWTVGDYRNPTLRTAIAVLKFEEVRGLVLPLASLLYRVLTRPAIEEYLDRIHRRAVLVPSPMDWRRLNQRGFNQASLLARAVGELANLPVVDLLTKSLRPAQSSLTDDERKENMQGAIRLRTPVALFGKTVILVDDVVTTGATAIESARVLRSVGARSVWVLALARG